MVIRMFDHTLSHVVQVTLNGKAISSLPVPRGKWIDAVSSLKSFSWLSWNTINQYGSIRNEFILSEKMTKSGNLVIKITRYGLSDKEGQLSTFIQDHEDYNDLKEGFFRMLKVFYK